MRVARCAFARRWYTNSGLADTDPLLLLHADKKVLQVEVIGARELFAGRFTRPNPYCRISVGTTSYKTDVAKRTTDPIWGSVYVFDFHSLDEEVVAEVWDEETFGKDDLLGTARTTVREVLKGQAEAEKMGKREVETFFQLAAPTTAEVAEAAGRAKLPQKAKDDRAIETAKAEEEWERAKERAQAEDAPPPSEIKKTDAAQAAVKSALEVPTKWVQSVMDSYSRMEALKNLPIPFPIGKDSQQQQQQQQQVTQGRLYLKFRIAPAKDLQRVLPHVVPPAKVPLDKVRAMHRKNNCEWAAGREAPRRYFRILSLDGGGVRGVLSAGILRRLVKSERFPHLLDDVDLIAGTSTGGILALLFAAGYSPAQAQALYQYHCPKIFTTTPARRYSPFTAKYTSTYLESVMKNYFEDLRVEELPRPVMVTAFRIRSDPEQQVATFFKSDGVRWRPAIFSNIEQFDGPVGPDSVSCTAVACRSSAAPTYFPSYQDFVDGGVFANNPVLCAISKATSHYRHVHAGRIAVLSIGAGSFNYHIPKQKDITDNDWGLRQWAPYLRALLLDSSSISLDTNMELLMGDRYCRVDPKLTTDCDLDDVGSIPELVSLSRKYDLTRTEQWIQDVFYKTWNSDEDNNKN